MQYGPALIRTVTNFIIAWALSIPIISGLNIDDNTWQLFVSAIVGSVYYALVHWAELHMSPKFSLLLASNKQPARYTSEPVRNEGVITR